MSDFLEYADLDYAAGAQLRTCTPTEETGQSQRMNAAKVIQWHAEARERVRAGSKKRKRRRHRILTASYI